MSRSLIEVAIANETTLNNIRALLAPHRQMGESDEEVLTRVIEHARKDLILDTLRDQDIQGCTLLSWNGVAHTVVLTKGGVEMRFERKGATTEADYCQGRDARRAGKPRCPPPGPSKDWCRGWDIEDDRITFNKGAAAPTGIAPPRIGDILVDDKGNRSMVTDDLAPDPHGTYICLLYTSPSPRDA